MFARGLKLGAACIGALFLLVAIVPAAFADDVSDAQNFVRVLADKAISQLTSPTLSQNEREDKFRVLLHEHFDVAAMGKSALGRYWRVATPTEQSEYMDLFEDLIVATYASKFRDYGGENLDITNVMPISGSEDNAILVQSQVVRNVAKPIRVDWRVSQPSQNPKIIDVVIEGVSMIQTQRSEFTSVIVRTGNKVSGLIEELRAKTKMLRAQAN